MSRMTFWRTASAPRPAALRLVGLEDERDAHTSVRSGSYECETDADDSAWVIPFQRTARPEPRPAHSARTLSADLQQRLLQRARILNTHRTCPECRCALVEPLELANSLLGRGNLPIPGTSTLVGFRCQSCRAEWPCESR